MVRTALSLTSRTPDTFQNLHPCDLLSVDHKEISLENLARSLARIKKYHGVPANHHALTCPTRPSAVCKVGLDSAAIETAPGLRIS